MFVGEALITQRRKDALSRGISGNGVLKCGGEENVRF
jgi:hypothetical protein